MELNHQRYEILGCGKRLCVKQEMGKPEGEKGFVLSVRNNICIHKMMISNIAIEIHLVEAKRVFR